MLNFYFLNRFYKYFFFFFFILAFIFTVSDLFVRLPMLPPIQSTPKLAYLMLPLMAQFAIPLASSLAIGMTLGDLYMDDEIILFYYFSKIRKAVYRSIFIFSFSLIIFYIPLIFVWGPESYKKGKEFLINLAKEQFYKLEPNKFHNPFPKFTLYFKEKKIENDILTFKKLLLMYQEKDNSRYIINAQQGHFVDNKILYLTNGVIQNIAPNKNYFLSFENTEIKINQLFESKIESTQDVPLKFLSFKSFKDLTHENNQIKMELVKRIAQIIWQFLIPFFSLFLIVLLAQKKSNILTCLASSGFIFFVYYITMSVSQVFYKNPLITILILYLPLILFLVIFKYFYYKKIN